MANYENDVRIRKTNLLIGQKFNNLTLIKIIGKDEKSNYLGEFKCDCGEIQAFPISQVKYGDYKWCRLCTEKKRKQSIDNTLIKKTVGKRFGKIVVLELLNDIDKFNHRLYKCLCDCGNIVNLTSQQLNDSKSKSCGKCGYQNKIVSDIMKNLHINTDLDIKNRERLIPIEGTTIHSLTRKHDPKKNETGITGVYYRKDRNLYYALIRFKGKKIYLGSSKDKYECEKLYLEAKEKYHNDFVKWYKNNTN